MRNNPSFPPLKLRGGPLLSKEGVRGSYNEVTFNDQKLKKFRKGLRKNQTDAERLIWNLVRSGQIQGLKFFRQYSVGPYVLDFYCPYLRLAIEIDGGQHNEMTEKFKDENRTRYPKALNIRVIRFWNNDVLANKEGVYEQILEAINWK
ncbi:MAG: endonuclease domain-containing protein [Parcubacteria group bacterium]|nr:endonuclease domain-containing protein [Parcubacteria group bacterium]